MSELIMRVQTNSKGAPDFSTAEPIIKCKECKRNANNGGLYDDGRTKCPIQEHYALLEDGFCQLGESAARHEWSDI